jgi:uncharacterized protein (UPF0264 family)
MRLLVSVSNAAEAADALAGGADVIDAKDPGAGPLGAVSLATFRRIAHAIRGARPLTAALGDASDPGTLRRTASAFATDGAWLVKVGFAGVAGTNRVADLLATAIDGVAEGCANRPAEREASGVIAVAYADAERAQAPRPDVVLALAARAGATGLLIDTFDKDGPGLRSIVGAAALTSLVEAGHQAGLLVALAGRLAAGDLPSISETGADVAGVRGAACGGRRTGRIDADRVRELRDVCARLSLAAKCCLP